MAAELNSKFISYFHLFIQMVMSGIQRMCQEILFCFVLFCSVLFCFVFSKLICFILFCLFDLRFVLYNIVLTEDFPVLDLYE